MDLIPGWGRSPLEEDMATHSNLLAWRILWTEEPGGLHGSMGRKELDDWIKWLKQVSMHTGTALVIDIWVIRALVEEISEKVPPLSATLPLRLYYIGGLFWFHLYLQCIRIVKIVLLKLQSITDWYLYKDK